jgi:hypothetical protein
MLEYNKLFSVCDIQYLKIIITEKILEAGRSLTTDEEQKAFADNPLHEKLASINKLIDTIINDI